MVSFLPLVSRPGYREDDAMHPYLVDELVRERWSELHRLSAAERSMASHAVPGWRRRAGRALATLAVALSVPPPRRAESRQQVGAALCLEPPC
jgi:hypothetical protein